MPVLDLSKSFRDINLSFKRHPTTNDLIVLKNEDAIKRSVMNCVFTIVNEKPFNIDFGTSVNSSLFDLDNGLNYLVIEKQITACLNQFEPRIRINKVTVQTDGQTNSMSARIVYTIIGMELPTQDIDVLIQPARV